MSDFYREHMKRQNKGDKGMKLFRYKAPFKSMNGTTYINYESQLALIRKANKKDESICGFNKERHHYLCARVWTGNTVLKNVRYWLSNKELNNEYVLLKKERI